MLFGFRLGGGQPDFGVKRQGQGCSKIKQQALDWLPGGLGPRYFFNRSSGGMAEAVGQNSLHYQGGVQVVGREVGRRAIGQGQQAEAGQRPGGGHA